MPDSTQPAISWSSDNTLRVQLGESPGAAARARVRAAFSAVRKLAGVADVTPAYTTLLVTFDACVLRDGADAELRVLDAIRAAGTGADAGVGRPIEIPVCYEGEDLAPDLSFLAAACGLSVARAIELHAAPEYEVEFLGFSPGFAYLAGLSDLLATPRHTTPRVRVPAGSVGIAGGQTGVYPGATPGGWRIIGRTPLRMFDAARAEPSLLRMGDRARFVPMSRADFASHGGIA